MSGKPIRVWTCSICRTTSAHTTCPKVGCKGRTAGGWDGKPTMSLPEHGTNTRYKNHGCRCELCRVAASEYAKAYKLRVDEYVARLYIERRGSRGD